MRGIVGSIALAALGVFVLALVELAGMVGGSFAGFVFLENGDVGPRLLSSVAASPEIGRLRPQDRLVAIDGVTVANGAEALARIERQRNLEHGWARADVVINTDGPLARARRAAERIRDRFLAGAAASRRRA